jgi:hypothetical protein
MHKTNLNLALFLDDFDNFFTFLGFCEKLLMKSKSFEIRKILSGSFCLFERYLNGDFKIYITLIFGLNAG